MTATRTTPNPKGYGAPILHVQDGHPRAFGTRLELYRSGWRELPDGRWRSPSRRRHGMPVLSFHGLPILDGVGEQCP